jgi:hypothetical protein
MATELIAYTTSKLHSILIDCPTMNFAGNLTQHHLKVGKMLKNQEAQVHTSIVIFSLILSVPYVLFHKLSSVHAPLW